MNPTQDLALQISKAIHDAVDQGKQPPMTDGVSQAEAREIGVRCLADLIQPIVAKREAAIGKLVEAAREAIDLARYHQSACYCDPSSKTAAVTQRRLEAAIKAIDPEAKP